MKAISRLFVFLALAAGLIVPQFSMAGRNPPARPVFDDDDDDTGLLIFSSLVATSEAITAIWAAEEDDDDDQYARLQQDAAAVVAGETGTMSQDFEKVYAEAQARKPDITRDEVAKNILYLAEAQ